MIACGHGEGDNRVLGIGTVVGEVGSGHELDKHSLVRTTADEMRYSKETQRALTGKRTKSRRNWFLVKQESTSDFELGKVGHRLLIIWADTLFMELDETSLRFSVGCMPNESLNLADERRPRRSWPMNVNFPNCPYPVEWSK